MITPNCAIHQWLVLVSTNQLTTLTDNILATVRLQLYLEFQP